jgi:hypothetical protein
MAVLSTSGRVAVAEALSVRPIHLAWGTGDPTWDETPVSESVDATELTNELGRVQAKVIGFATPDALGEIEVPTGHYTMSENPTNHLYLRFDFGFADAADQVIREAGVFLDTVVVDDLPNGQRYLVPTDIANTGRLLAIEHFTGVVRSPLVRQQFEMVLTI